MVDEMEGAYRTQKRPEIPFELSSENNGERNLARPKYQCSNERQTGVIGVE